MRRHDIIWMVGLAFGLPVILIGAGLLLVNTPTGKRWVSLAVSEVLERQVMLEGGITVKPTWPLTLRISQLRIANAPDHKPATMLELGEMEVQVSLAPLLRGNFDFPQVMLRDTQLVLQKDKIGKANWVFGKHETQDKQEQERRIALPVIHSLILERSKVIY